MSEVKNMDFGQALNNLRAGHRVSREGWNGLGMWLGLQIPDSGSKMGLPYIYISTSKKKLCPWTPSQCDVLAADWVRVAHE